ncbi:MAG: Gldg family protein [Anaerolineae bacterium]|nr:Gldg family protein [Anaerolineae bacterium]MCI0610474.1 Gldg family protein [Anaerolineae bacterium]
MKNNTKQSAARNYSVAALIVALIACIITFFLGIIRGLVAAQVTTVANVENLQRYLLVSAGFIVIGVAAYAILEPERVRRFLTGRQARYGSNAFIMSIAFAGILIIGNVLAYQNPVPIGDLTEDQVNTLAPETLAAIKKLPQKVSAIAFFSQNSNKVSATELLDKIKSNSNGKFEYQFIDPDRDPQAAINAGITGDGKILLQMGEQKEIVAFASETELLKGMLRLLNPGNNVIYFLTGHGEKDVEQSSETSMTRAKSTLESKNYVVKTLNLAAENQIPEDASVIVIAGPIKPVSKNEVTLLEEYLNNGGSLVVMEDPTILTEFGDEPDPLADMLATDWGILLDNDVVIDLGSADPTVAVSAFYDSSHTITRNMNQLATYFPFTRSLSVAAQMEGITTSQLVQTVERSWGETDFTTLSQGGGQLGFDEGVETPGPMTIVIASEKSTPKSRVVVYGSSTFVIDKYFDASGNGDLFINSVDWTAEQEDIIELTPKTPTERTFTPPSQFQWIAILLGSVLIIPGLVVLAGISTWLTRRRQG